MKFALMLSNGRAKILAAALAMAILPLATAQAQTMAQPGNSPGMHPPAPRGEMKSPALPDFSKDDPAKVAAAHAFIVAYHPRQAPAFVSKMLDKYMPRMIAAAKERDSKMDVKTFERERRALLLQKASENMDTQAHVISRHFTLQELNALAGFFRGGVGKKLVDESPNIQMEMMMAQRRRTLFSPLPGVKPSEKKSAPAKGSGTPHK